MSAVATVPLVRLDIACGASKPEGWVGLDVAAVPGVDHVCDVFQFPWPLADSSVAEARCLHFVEHLPHREAPHVEVTPGLRGGVISSLPRERWARSVLRWGHVRDLWFDFWEEVHRVLAPDGKITVVTPYYASDRADQDPTHERRICEASYFYLSQAWLAGNRCAYPFAADFEVVGMGMLGCKDPAKAQQECRRHLNVVEDLLVELKAKKPARCWWKETP